MGGRLRRVIYTLFIILLIINLFYLSFHKRLSALESKAPIRFLLYPSYWLSKGYYFFDSQIDKLLNLSKAYEEAQDLRKKVNLLNAENLLLKNQIESLESRLNLEKIKKSYPFSIEVSRVIGRNPLFWHQYVIIEGGRDRDFLAGMPVIAENGLVGKIVEVYHNASKVLLIIDQDFACDVRGDRSDILALSVGTGSSVMKLNYVPKYEDFKPGETLVTSGLDNSFPPGIPVGFIVEISKPFGSYFLEAFVMPYVDVLRLKDLMVIKSFKKDR